MKLRDKLCKEVIKEKDSQRKIKRYETQKKYRNEIVDLLKVGKQTHYKNYFEENKKTVKLIFDDSGVFAPNNVIIQKNTFLSRSNHKKVFRKLIEKRSYLSPF